MAGFNWKLSVHASGQTPITASRDAQDIEAVDRITVELAPGDADKIVAIQPGSATAISLLLITSDHYGTDFSYRASDGSTDSAAITLDAPQIYSNGNVALFGVDPLQLKLSNSSADQTVAIQVFVARDATP